MPSENESRAPMLSTDLQRISLRTQGFSEEVISTMLQCRREPSNKLYSCYLNKWNIFCDSNGMDPCSAPVSSGLDFLQSLYADKDVHRGVSAISTARSAISSVLSLPDSTKFGDNRFVKMFMKGINSVRPSEPRYIRTWDPEVVLDLLRSNEFNPVQDLCLLKLSKKLVMLILLSTYQRGQIIKALNLDRFVQLSDDEIVFKILAKDLKQGNVRGYKPNPITFKSYAEKEICVLTHVLVYIEKTSQLRGDVRELMLTSRKPFRMATRDTISRWIKDVMAKAGIDINVFAPGSVRGASTSNAFKNGVPLDEICIKAGWTRESTFRKWYQR